MWINLQDGKAKEIAAALKKAGLEHEAKEVEQFAKAARKNGKYREAADRLYHRDGDLEVDDGAVVSKGNDAGAYVMCWKWISNDEL